MSPPDTNLNTQKRRHRGPLIGLALVVLFGVGIILFWILEESATAPGPVDDSGEQVGFDELAPGAPPVEEALGEDGQDPNVTVDDLQEGDVEVPTAPAETVEPGDEGTDLRGVDEQP